MPGLGASPYRRRLLRRNELTPLTKYGSHINPLEQARRAFWEQYKMQRTTTYRRQGVFGAALRALKQARRQYRYAMKTPNKY